MTAPTESRLFGASYAGADYHALVANALFCRGPFAVFLVPMDADLTSRMSVRGTACGERTVLVAGAAPMTASGSPCGTARATASMAAEMTHLFAWSS